MVARKIYLRNVPGEVKKLVRQRKIIFSAKARHQLDNGRFYTGDLINSLLYGKLVKKERDEYHGGEYKYVIIGPAHSGAHVYSCGKIVQLHDENYFIITFHETK